MMLAGSEIFTVVLDTTRPVPLTWLTAGAKKSHIYIPMNCLNHFAENI